MLANDQFEEALVRYRLTLPDRDIEIEPSAGVQLIGRAPECQILVDDPLVSRQHAKIWCEGCEVVFEDLKSRNGSRINGCLVHEARVLNHGDRIQLGSHEFVFCQESLVSEVRIPVARGDAAEPGVEPATEGAWPAQEQITVVAWVGPGEETAQARWPLEMLVEMLGKAMLSGRRRDAMGIMEQAVITVNRALEASEPLDLVELDALSDAALWLQKVQHTDRWLRWISEVYTRAGYPRRGTQRGNPAPNAGSQADHARNAGRSGSRNFVPGRGSS